MLAMSGALESLDVFDLLKNIFNIQKL